MRVLIADDQKSVGTALAALVTQCGHEVVAVVSSGLEAIQAYGRLTPDVVLMDYWMPRLNGATACRNILSKHPEARVILVSGASLQKEVTNSGAVVILPKPVQLDALYAALYEAGSPRPVRRHSPSESFEQPDAAESAEPADSFDAKDAADYPDS